MELKTSNHSKKYAVLFIAGVAGGWALFSHSPASAAWQRYSTMDCGTWYNVAGTTPDSLGMGNYHSGWNYIMCAIDDTSSVPKQSLVTVSVHVRDNSDTAGVSASVCVTFWPSNGGACGTSSSTGTADILDATLSPGRQVWDAAHAGDFGYVKIVLPPYDSQTGASNVRGIFTST